MTDRTHYYVAVAPDGLPLVFASSKRDHKFAVVMLREKFMLREKEEEGLRHWMVITAQRTEDAARYKALAMTRALEAAYAMYNHHPEHSDTPCYVVPLGRVRWSAAEPQKLRSVIPCNGAKALS